MGSPTDHLFVGTDRAMFFTLSWDPGSRQLKTEKSYLDLADRTARESQTGDRCLIDPTNEFLTLEVYEGIITTLPLVKKDKKKNILESGILGEPAVSRISEFFVRSSAFLPRVGEKPRLALLHEDYDQHVRLKIRELTYVLANGGDSIVEFEDDEASQRSHPMDPGANLLVPISGPPCMSIARSVTLHTLTPSRRTPRSWGNEHNILQRLQLPSYHKATRRSNHICSMGASGQPTLRPR
jgi:DNA damage-binding protein 1